MGHSRTPLGPLPALPGLGRERGGEKGALGREEGATQELLAAEGSLALLRAGAPSQAHVIQPDLPGVAVPPLALEDDLGENTQEVRLPPLESNAKLGRRSHRCHGHITCS